MSIHEEHGRTIEENAVMEQNRQAWAEGLATGAIRFYRRGWRNFESTEAKRGQALPGPEISPGDRQAVSTDGGQRLQATGGAGAWRLQESGGATTTMSADGPYARSIEGREDEPEAVGLGGERGTEHATVSGVQTGTSAASESGKGSRVSHDH